MLLQQGVEPRIFDINDNRATLTEIAGAQAAQELDWRVADIRDGQAVAEAAEGCDGIVHLAGVLTPACRANPVRGAEINLIGTLNVFEAALKQGLGAVVNASSAGVFGPEQAAYPEPTTLYGGFKLAGEAAARAYWADHQLASLSFRPLVVYGPGRELGLSAGPSLACRAAARGEAYVHPFSGVAGLMYVEDVARIFIAALVQPLQGARVRNLVGEELAVDAVLAEIRRQVPDARLSVDGPPLPISPGIAQESLDDLLPADRRTSLAQGVAATIAHYRAA